VNLGVQAQDSVVISFRDVSVLADELALLGLHLDLDLEVGAALAMLGADALALLVVVVQGRYWPQYGLNGAVLDTAGVMGNVEHPFTGVARAEACWLPAEAKSRLNVAIVLLAAFDLYVGHIQFLVIVAKASALEPREVVNGLF